MCLIRSTVNTKAIVPQSYPADSFETLNLVSMTRSTGEQGLFSTFDRHARRRLQPHQRLLGPLHEESCVLVHAVDGDGYDYVGSTRNAGCAEANPFERNIRRGYGVRHGGDRSPMTGREAKRLFLLLAAFLFAFHVQTMDHVPAAPHVHASEHNASGHSDSRCASVCCSTAACCLQAVVAYEVDAPEPRSPIFVIPSQRAVALAAVDPPDPPPRPLAV